MNSNRSGSSSSLNGRGKRAVNDPYYELYRQECLRAGQPVPKYVFEHAFDAGERYLYDTESQTRREIHQRRIRERRGIMRRSRSEIVLPKYGGLFKTTLRRGCGCSTCKHRHKSTRNEREKSIITFVMRLAFVLMLSHVASSVSTIAWEYIVSFLPKPREPTFIESMLYYIGVVAYFLSYYLADCFIWFFRRVLFLN